MSLYLLGTSNYSQIYSKKREKPPCFSKTHLGDKYLIFFTHKDMAMLNFRESTEAQASCAVSLARALIHGGNLSSALQARWLNHWCKSLRGKDVIGFGMVLFNSKNWEI